MRLATPLLLFFLTFALAVPASGYVRTRNYVGQETAWTKPHLVFSLVPPSTVFELSEAQVLEVLQRALSNWRQAAEGTDVTLELGPRANRASVVESDRVNVIKFREGNWCPDHIRDRYECYDRSRRAQTKTYLRPDASIAEADIEINAVHFQWTPESLERVLTHEIGHALGLDHNCAASSLERPHDHLGAKVPNCRSAEPALQMSLMYDDPNQAHGSHPLKPERDEQDFLRAVYPERDSFSAVTGAVACQFSRTSAGSPCFLTALLLICGLWRVRRSGADRTRNAHAGRSRRY